MDLARGALGRLVGVHRFVVYEAEAARAARTPDDPRIVCRPLRDDEVLALANGPPELRRHAARLARYGFNGAHAVFMDGALSHVAWVLGHREQRERGVGNVRIDADAVEIAHCVTPESARGRGAYGISIGYLSGLVAARGVRRVIMVVNERNAASRRGVERAGLREAGRLVKVVLPWLRSWRGLRWHRRTAP